jgi:hypothetical protein
MPFEPRLVHGDDEPARDLALPADLVELSGQLSEESALLAERYPAGSVRSDPARGRSPRWVAVQWRGVAAAAIISTAIWGISRDWSAVRQPAAGRGGVVRLNGDGSAAPTIQNINSSSPATFFQELNGPEREGLLDLLEEERLNRSSLSI